MATLIAFLLIALLFSFLCSVLEAVVLSIPPTYVAAQKGKLGRELQQLKRDIDRPLAAILTLNTFAHTIGAAGVGAAAQDLWGKESLTVVSALVTVVILIGSEIIPKTLGAVYAQQLVKPVAVIIIWLTRLLLPVVWVCQLITRVFRGGYAKSILSRSDVSQVAEVGFRDGLVRRHEFDIIANLMAHEDLRTAHIMTPMEKVVACDERTPVSQINRRSPTWHVSRIPVYSKDASHVTGYVLKDEALGEQLAGRRKRALAELRRPIPAVKPSAGVAELYKQLIEASEHIAIVVDETQHAVGLVTMEDVIEALIGEDITDETDAGRQASATAYSTD